MRRGAWRGAWAGLAEALLSHRATRPPCARRPRRLTNHVGVQRCALPALAPGRFEFPSVDGCCGSARHRRIYLTRGTAGGILHSGIAAFDTRTGALDAFDFGREVQAGEPVFAARPGGAGDEGWLIAQTLDAARQVSEFAVFDAGHVADGPIARIALGEPVPLGFHGCWVPG
jgi:carotenoid cleavage dioxygenase